MASEFAVSHAWKSDTRTPLRWILSHVVRHKFIILMIFLGAFGNAAGGALVPYFTGIAFDAIVQPTPDTELLFWVCFWLVVSQGVRGVLQLGRNFGSELLGQRLERDAREELYGSLLGKSMRFHDQHPTGDLMARATNDVHELALMFSPGINLAIGSGNFLIMPLLFSPGIHPQLILTPIFFLIAYVLSVWHYLRQLNPVTAEVRKSFGEMNAALAQSIEGIETVKGMAQESTEISRFEKMSNAVRNAFVKQGALEARFLPLLLYGIATGTGFWHGIVLLQAGEISVGDVVAYVGLIQLFSFPVFISLLAYSQASSGISSGQRILELITGDTELDQNKGGHTATMHGDLRFDNVTFRYQSTAPDGSLPERDALRNVSFSIVPGQLLAVVGQTGAGKSTIAKLINRTYDIDTGRITVDGVDVRDWDLEGLRQQISIIEQDIFLFSRSIRDNIAFANPAASQEEVEIAAKAAQAHDFIMTLPEGYNTVVGERGVMLSGGQRQRLAIARAFMTHPAILILDDSTSAIDSATEDEIQKAIEVAAEGRTTILITHRLSQIRRADKILVLKKGEVVAFGTHDTLMETTAAYREIFVNLE
jgi:ATP-binding cassette subfamily B protein